MNNNVSQLGASYHSQPSPNSFSESIPVKNLFLEIKNDVAELKKNYAASSSKYKIAELNHGYH